MMYLGFIQSCEHYDNIDDCLFLGTNDCKECPYGYNFNKKEVDIQEELDPQVLESRTDKNDSKRNPS